MSIHNITRQKTAKSGNRIIDNAGFAAFVLTAGAAWLASEAHQVPANFWGAAAFLALPFAAMLSCVGFVTLTQGPERFIEFWRFHERRHGVSIRLLAWFYVPLAALGLIAATKIWL